MNIHWGSTRHPGCFRFHQGTISSKSMKQECYFEQPIEWMYGISFAWCFLGLIKVGLSKDVREIKEPQS
jgi:hypothetical protein